LQGVSQTVLQLVAGYGFCNRFVRDIASHDATAYSKKKWYCVFKAFKRVSAVGSLENTVPFFQRS